MQQFRAILAASHLEPVCGVTIFQFYWKSKKTNRALPGGRSRNRHRGKSALAPKAPQAANRRSSGNVLNDAGLVGAEDVAGKPRAARDTVFRCSRARAARPDRRNVGSPERPPGSPHDSSPPAGASGWQTRQEARQPKTAILRRSAATFPHAAAARSRNHGTDCAGHDAPVMPPAQTPQRCRLSPCRPASPCGGSRPPCPSPCRP